MKKLFIGLLALGSLSAYAANDCRKVIAEYKTKQLYESLSIDAIGSGTMYGGLAVGGIVESTGAFGTAAALGSTLSIASFFIPSAIYGGIEGTIAIINAPHTKALNLIDQAYQFKKSKNFKKVKLLKRIAKKLDMSNEDLAETIIRSNEDGSLCSENKTKKDIIESIKIGNIQVLDVDETSYSGNTLRWTCGAQPKYYQGQIYTASANKKSIAKKKALAECSEATGVECEWSIYCKNNESGTTSQRF